MLGVLAVGLAFLRAVDAVQTDAFRMLVVQDFNSVAIMHTDDFPVMISAKDDEVNASGKHTVMRKIVGPSMWLREKQCGRK
jgi:hypothetical protein